MTKKKWKREDITPEVLRELLHLDGETGKLYWKERGPEWFEDGYFTKETSSNKWNTRNSGKETFIKVNQNGGGYVGQILGVKFCKTIVVYAIKNGRLPTEKIYNGIETSQSIINHHINALYERTTYKGVSLSTGNRSKPYRSVFLGRETYHDSPIEAARAYDAKAYELYGHHARLNFPEDYGLQPHDDDAIEVPEGYFED